jgi:hypothetical protein
MGSFLRPGLPQDALEGDVSRPEYRQFGDTRTSNVLRDFSGKSPSLEEQQYRFSYSSKSGLPAQKKTVSAISDLLCLTNLPIQLLDALLRQGTDVQFSQGN